MLARAEREQLTDQEQAARRLRRHAVSLITSAKSFLNQANRAVAEHGRAPLAAELGAEDAQELQALFIAAKALLESHSDERVEEDLVTT